MKFSLGIGIKTLAVCAAVAGLAANLKATSTFTFGNAVNSGNNTSYTWNSTSGPAATLTTTGYFDPNAPSGNDVTGPNTNPAGNKLIDLYYNSSGPGLGLQNSNGNVLTVNQYITNNGFIQLSFSGSVSSLSLNLNSVSDYWYVYGSNTAGALGTLLNTSYPTAEDNGSFTISVGAYQFYDVIASEDCQALLGSLTAVITPEPATFALLGISLGVMLLIARRSRKSAKA